MFMPMLKLSQVSRHTSSPLPIPSCGAVRGLHTSPPSSLDATSTSKHTDSYLTQLGTTVVLGKAAKEMDSFFTSSSGFSSERFEAGDGRNHVGLAGPGQGQGLK